MPQTGSGGETGVYTWGYDARSRGFKNDEALKSLQAFKQAVHRNAYREVLQSVAESLNLPAEYCEFYKQAAGASCENWDRTKLVCDFARWFRTADEQAHTLHRMCEYRGAYDMEAAAGWLAGKNDRNTYIHSLFCKDEESDKPWQWRTLYTDLESADIKAFDSLHEFLGWYASGYDWVLWRHVGIGIEDLHWKCQRGSNHYTRTQSRRDGS